MCKLYHILSTYNKKLNTYNSIRQQFSVSLAVDYLHDQTHAVHTTITGHFLNNYTHTYVSTHELSLYNLPFMIVETKLCALRPIVFDS